MNNNQEIETLRARVTELEKALKAQSDLQASYASQDAVRTAAYREVATPPTSPVEDEAKVNALIERCANQFDTIGHDEAWRNTLAVELNEIIGRVKWTLETDGCDVDITFAEAALSVVNRVAESEEIGRL